MPRRQEAQEAQVPAMTVAADEAAAPTAARTAEAAAVPED